MELLNIKSKKKRILFLLILISTHIAGLVFWLLLKKLPSAEKIRNVVLISIDTCRADYLSCYGYPEKTTPNIDAIAEDGILFENVITPMPMTLPGHASMLTGTIPPYH